MLAGGIADTLTRALGVVAREVPAADQLLREASQGVTARLRVGTECFVLALAASGERVLRGAEPPEVRLEIGLSTDTLLALLDGDITLHDAILEERLVARGATQDLLSFGESLAWFLKGALRVSSADELLDDLQNAAAARRE